MLGYIKGTSYPLHYSIFRCYEDSIDKAKLSYSLTFSGMEHQCYFMFVACLSLRGGRCS